MNPKKKRMKPLRFVKKYGRVLIGAVIIAVVLLVVRAKCRKMTDDE